MHPYIDQGILEDLAVGATVLGAGGGGDPYLGKLMARQAIELHGPVELVAAEEIAGDGLVLPVAMMGVAEKAGPAAAKDYVSSVEEI